MAVELTTSPVVLTSAGQAVGARVFRKPADPTERQPVVVVSGSWLTVQEQMAHRYATALASHGYTAVTFDFTGWGMSRGEPRHAELPDRKIADIVAVTQFASRLAYGTGGPVGYLAVCASAQYALAAIAQGAPIASFASVAGWFHDIQSVAPFYGGAEGVALRLQRGEEATARYLRTGETQVVPAYEAGNDRAGMHIELDYYSDPLRGAIPQWPNEMAELSWVPWLTFDGLAAAGQVSTPTLIVHSDGCVFPENITRLRAELQGPVEVAWGDGWQLDYYDQQAQVEFAVAAANAHFGKTLPAG